MSQGASLVCSAFLTLGQSGEPMSHLGLQLAQLNRQDHLHSKIPRNIKLSPFLIVGQYSPHPPCWNLWHTFVPKMLVRIDCTVPKLMLTSLAMLHISHLLSYIARVCTTLTFSSVVASLGQPDRPSFSMLSLPLYCPFYHCAIRKRLLPKVYNYLPLFIYLDILYVLFRIKDHSMANFHTPLFTSAFLISVDLY